MRKFAAVLFLVPAMAFAATRGTATEAKAMLAKAVAHYKSVGRTQALADFNAGKAPFRDRDLYVFCISHDLIRTANGAFPQYVGTSADTLKDAHGNPLGQAMLKAARTPGGGSVKYDWLNPMTHQMEPKTAFLQDLGQDVCGVGAYTP